MMVVIDYEKNLFLAFTNCSFFSTSLLNHIHFMLFLSFTQSHSYFDHNNSYFMTFILKQITKVSTLEELHLSAECALFP